MNPPLGTDIWTAGSFDKLSYRKDRSQKLLNYELVDRKYRPNCGTRSSSSKGVSPVYKAKGGQRDSTGTEKCFEP